MFLLDHTLANRKEQHNCGKNATVSRTVPRGAIQTNSLASKWGGKNEYKKNDGCKNGSESYIVYGGKVTVVNNVVKEQERDDFKKY